MQWWRAALAALSLLALGVGVGGDAALERELLQMLGLKRRPRVDRDRVDVPEAMRALYRHFSAGALFLSQQQRAANTVRSYTHMESYIDERFKGEHKFRLAFNVSVPDDEALKAAELVLSRDSVRLTPHDRPPEQKYRVSVYDIVKPGVKGGAKPSLRLLDTKYVKGERSGTVRLDVSSAVERWLWRPVENHGLLVEVKAPKGVDRRHVRLKRSPEDSHESWRARQPLLLAFLDDHRGRAGEPKSIDDPKSRSTRAAHRRPYRRKSSHDLCQRRSLLVDFGDVGWSDWIVAPGGYNAFYCHGECPYPLGEHLNTTNHAVVQTLVNSMSPTTVPKACCVPTHLSSIAMLYMEENKVVLKNYQEMAVEGCGCR